MNGQTRSTASSSITRRRFSPLTCPELKKVLIAAAVETDQKVNRPYFE
jgi:hypothetical protein